MTLIDMLDQAGLTGRGGAAFSTATKVRAAGENGADLIVNACDGELGALKDAWVVTHHLPELVHGAALVTAGSRRRVRYAAHRGSATEATLRAAGLEVLSVPGRYVSSEESALIALAHGGLARPMTKRQPFVAGGRDSRGRRVRPTVVLNAETVWRVAQIADRGPEWFRSHGTQADPGPRLVTVTGYVPRPQVIETQAGVTMLSLLEATGGLRPDADAVLVGGLGGVFLTADAARHAWWSREGLAAHGASLGPGLLDVVDPRWCPLRQVANLLAYAAGESAGQCGPCMFGLPAVAEAWRELADSPSATAQQRVLTHAGLLPGRGACRFPDGIAAFTRSALQVHAHHLQWHHDGHCPQHERTQRRAEPA